MVHKSAKPAEVFPAHEYITDEMEARGWRIEDLAEQAGWSLALTSEVVSGKHRITKLVAYGLAQAFGTSMTLWLNLDRGKDG